MRSTFKVLFYLKRNKCKDQKVVPVMGRITVNGSIAQFSAKLSVPEMLWEVSGGRAKGRSLEADRINRHLDNIRTQIGKHYQDICDRESYVTAEKVKNAYLGFGEKYRLLLEAFEKFTGDLKKRVGIDRCHGTWNRYYKSIDHLRTFMRKEYNVSDMPLAELEQSFIEQYHVYLKSDLGLKPTTVSGYLKCLKYVVKIAFNNGWMPRNPFSLYQYTAPNPERSFLTEDELRRMMTTELRYKRQDYNRDMFLFSCFTGICYADMASLTYDRIEQDAQGEWWISGNRQKTETRYVVKLLPYALFILNKYRGLTGDGRVFAMSTLDSIDGAGRLSKGMVNEHLRTSGISSSNQNSVSIIPSRLPVSGSSSAHSATLSAAAIFFTISSFGTRKPDSYCAIRLAAPSVKPTSSPNSRCFM